MKPSRRSRRLPTFDLSKSDAAINKRRRSTLRATLNAGRGEPRDPKVDDVNDEACRLCDAMIRGDAPAAHVGGGAEGAGRLYCFDCANMLSAVGLTLDWRT